MSETTPSPVPAAIPFSSLNLIPPLMQALDRAGYKNASPIQEKVIPVASTGRDVIGQAQTGTGKTAAFLLPFMNQWRGGDLRFPQALILLPTRELAVQVMEEANKLSPSKHFRTVVLYGGQPFPKQLNALKLGCTLVVGTPGRVNDHLQRGTLDIRAIKYVVLDEADRMLDIGFRPQIDRIMRKMPQRRQTLLMSATLPDAVKRLTTKYMYEPETINVSPQVLTVDKIDQKYMTVDEDKKLPLLLKVLEREQPRQCIIFVERKRTADRLLIQLRKTYQQAEAIHGDLQQNQRDKIMLRFREGKIAMLIATDVMSRGIDVSGISHILNYDLPNDLESYVHRIGRTGRMGKDGVAISFVTPDQGELLTSIENIINRLIPSDSIEGFVAFEPKKKSADAPPKPSQPVFGRGGRKYSNRL